MSFGTVLSVAQTLLTALQCPEVRKICSIFGYKSELENLELTVLRVKAVFQDAEAKEELSHEAQLWIEELKDVVYDADDLLDEFATLAKRKQIKKADAKVSDKVSRFFSRLNPLGIAYKMSQGVKKIRKKLDAIASDHTRFGFSVDYRPIRRRREETCSYVYADDIIGRELDLENIVGLLLDSDAQSDVSFLTVVGIGGLGKTALAQLVYNDGRVKEGFPLKLWTCVSDQDQKQLDVKTILCKILESSSGQTHYGSTMDSVRRKLQEVLAANKYLLVLDDVWTENRNEWLKLVGFLRECQRGSWVVVTTRSRETARIIGNGPMYELQGLSKENSWRLFQRTAFEPGHTTPCDELAEIGQEILKKCANVPLAVRVVGSLLYGQEKGKWLSVRDTGLAKIRESQDGITPILKLSYHHLESPIKSCFSYCALFPKDYRINKEMLISLWVAQGYIVPLDEGQDMQDAGEEYFSILLRRCFFQDVEKDDYGEIIACKIHDLMHDVSQQIAGNEINGKWVKLDKKVRHMFVVSRKCVENIFSDDSKIHIRTFFPSHACLQGLMDQLHTDTLLSTCTSLRVLKLSYSDIEIVPASIGKLLHLRYLDLSYNYNLQSLGKSITKLHNLELLNLAGCRRLQELPKDLSKLDKLRILDIEYCHGLTYMPQGMGKLTRLHKLPILLVNEARSSTVDQLEDLGALAKLKGCLDLNIYVPEKATYLEGDGRREGAYLRSKEHLKEIRLHFKRVETRGIANSDQEEALLEDLQPPSNVRSLKLTGYGGVSMPRWASEDKLATFVPNLVRLKLANFENLQCFPSLGNLLHLKVLRLENLPKMEYVENNPVASTPGSSDELGLSFFPSIERIELQEMPNLKSWRRRVGDDLLLADSSYSPSNQSCIGPSFPCFSHLEDLSMHGCPKMTCITLCPILERLSLSSFSKSLRIIVSPSTYTSSLPLLNSGNSRQAKLRSVCTDSVAWLNSLTIEILHSVTHMYIVGDKELESLSEVGEVFCNPASSLHTLRIGHCPKVRVLTRGLENLTALESLIIDDIPNLLSNNAENHQVIEEDAFPWISLNQSLRSLGLHDISEMVNLPTGLQCLTSLQSLTIHDCKLLGSLPDWILKLTSLKELRIWGCSASLSERCQDPTGEDWPNIQHIPYVSIRD